MTRVWLLLLGLAQATESGDAQALLRRGISLSREASFAASVAALEQARSRGLVSAEAADCGYWLATDYLALGSAQTNNAARIAMSVDKAAKGLIKKGVISEGLLNMVEMAFRAYDPCFGCATHALPGHLPLAVSIYDSERTLVQRLDQA